MQWGRYLHILQRQTLYSADTATVIMSCAMMDYDDESTPTATQPLKIVTHTDTTLSRSLSLYSVSLLTANVCHHKSINIISSSSDSSYYYYYYHVYMACPSIHLAILSAGWTSERALSLTHCCCVVIIIIINLVAGVEARPWWTGRAAAAAGGINALYLSSTRALMDFAMYSIHSTSSSSSRPERA